LISNGGFFRGERDISEKIALGLAQPTVSKDSMFDQRLFNQSSGLGSGFGGEDSYSSMYFCIMKFTSFLIFYFFFKISV
jgi:hypothetical protein